MPPDAQMTPDPAGHIPVLLRPLLDAVAPVSGVWIDGTYGAGGYARGLLAAGAARVIGIDRDPDVIAAGASDPRITLVEGEFAHLDTLAGDGAPVAGVVLDIGVSSMQLDRAERGFSFAQDGPLDMRMSQSGPSAADLVNTAPEALLADILFQYGEERASRRIARKIVAVRSEVPLVSTRDLARLVESCLPRAKPGQAHPATRSFQAIRIAVNDELGQLVDALEAAERVLAPGGWLAVVTFHSLEDRIVKRFMQIRAGDAAGGSRHAPEAEAETARFERRQRKAITADDAEIAANPRARSARLRVARRTGAAAGPVDRRALGLPDLALSDLALSGLTLSGQTRKGRP